MPDPSDANAPNLPMLGGTHDPSKYRNKSAKERFAVAKFYGMGSDGEWTVAQIAEEMGVTERQVYRYLNESEVGQEVREVLATTEAEWRLDMALQLRTEVKRLEEIERELLQRKQAVATAFEEKTVEGAPTGDRNIRLPDEFDTYKLKLPVPVDFETVTDYGPDLERVQKEKRQYLQQISKLLGLNAATKKEVDHTLASRHEEVKIVEYREGNDDDYPEAEVIDVDGEAAQIDVEAVPDATGESDAD